MDSDLIHEIKEDHRELEAFYGKYKEASNFEDKQRWVNQYVWEICRHAVGEELVMYPLMEKVGPKGKEIADKSREDHKKIKTMLEDMLKENNEALFCKKFEDAYQFATEHNNGEEMEDLVFIEENVSLEDRVEAAKKFSGRKKIAPTRPHPGIPNDSPTVQALLGFLVAPMDKMKDLFTSFPEPKELDKVEDDIPKT